MAKQVVMTAQTRCTFSVMTTSVLLVNPVHQVVSSFMPAATIMDFVPFTNIVPFPLCKAPLNPSVKLANAGTGGEGPLPGTCTPVTMPWTKGATDVLLGGIPALDDTSTCQCVWGGTVSIVKPGQQTQDIP